MLDLILVGGGLSNGLIAWRLLQSRPEMKVLLIDSGCSIGGNHIWSFHQHDLSEDQHRWIAPLVTQVWKGYQVKFPELSRHISSRYYSIESEHFGKCIANALGDKLLLNSKVVSYTPTSVRLKNHQVLTSRCVIDGRGVDVDHLHQTGTGAQIFFGQQWKLSCPHHIPVPILMDATVIQQHGYNFLYILPFNKTRLLMEYTRYTNSSCSNIEDEFRNAIKAYAFHKGWSLEHLEREEYGCLPIPIGGDRLSWCKGDNEKIFAGMRAGLFHATTGYSLPMAVHFAESIAKSTPFDPSALLLLTQKIAYLHWRRQKFFRLLNRLLFLTGPPEDQWRILQRFYRLPEQTIARFYAGRITFVDKMRILIGKPIVPIIQAIRAAMFKGPTQ